MKWWGGLVALGVGAGLGAAIGAAANPQDFSGKLNRGFGAVVGGAAGVIAVGFTGAIAALAPSTRAAGATAFAGATALTLAAGYAGRNQLP